ncbi:MAG: PD40 domain-containing protein [Acidobacteria bacterium]|nr:PD40 domain-containing protein [Acidobacteriota bacterium]
MKLLLQTIFLAGGLVIAQKTGETLFQQALMKERSQGDLKGAIELYQRIAKDFSGDRKLAAKALLEMARCQEKQGGEQARRTYERLVKDYADQSETVATARGRIAALTASAPIGSGPRVRQLWSGPDADDEGSISPDGRYLTYAHWDTGDLGLRDLATNTTKLLTNTGGWAKSNGEFAQDSRFSPDGKKIAYNWFLKNPAGQGGYELRLMNSDGSGVRTIGWAGGEGYPVPLAWSPDGITLATAFYGADGLFSLYLISLSTGERKELVAPGQFRNAQLASFSPDGKWLSISGPSRGPSDIYVVSTSGGSPVPIVTHSANDSYPHWSADGRGVLFLSNRTGAYGLWYVPVEDGRPNGPIRSIREDLAQGVNGIGFTNSGAMIFARRVGGSDIYSATVDPATGRLDGQIELISSRRPGGHLAPVLSPDARRLLYRTIVLAENGVSATIREISTGVERSVALPGPPISAIWAPDGERLLLETNHRPNSKELLWFDPASGNTTPFLTISPARNPLCPVFSKDGKTLYLLFREWPEEAVAVEAIDVASKEKRTLHKASYKDGGNLRGLAISPDGSLLASIRRLEGERRELVVIPVTGGQPRVVAAYEATDSFINHSAFSHDGRAVYAWIGKGRSSVGTGQLLRVDLNSGAMQPTGIHKKAIHSPVVDPSGRKIYFQAGTTDAEIWIAENIIPSQPK